MARVRAAVGSAVFLAAAPGVVAGVVPWGLTGWRSDDPPAPVAVLGVALIVAGAGVVLHSFVAFVVEGRGTPAPIAPTERLVVGGMYRHVRNPMYVAVGAMIVGQALLLGRLVLLAYFVLFASLVVTFVRLYEEPTLSARYGESYAEYRSAVPGCTRITGAAPPKVKAYCSNVGVKSMTSMAHPTVGRMNGAQALIRTLVAAGVDVCFANPGTSEMHFVAALDDVPDMRAVLTLFEGVAAGAADGYGRMAGRPAATLLHLGPGLGNAIANLHNARRARTPLVNVVGDHATTHKRLDAPLESDIDALAGTVSGWVRRSLSTRDLADDAAQAVAAAGAGVIATLVLPADVSWGDGGEVAAPRRVRARPRVQPDLLAEAVLGPDTVLFLGGTALTPEGLLAAGRLAAQTGARLLCETFPARLARGAGLPVVRPLPYPPEPALAALADVRHLVLVGAKEPVAFFAYPGLPGRLAPEGCDVFVLAEPGDDAEAALVDLAALVAPDAEAVVAEAARPALPTGPLTPARIADVLGALLPEGAIVVDEALTSGGKLHPATAGAPRHDWLTLTGGAIGQGLPAALGAAVACPDRPVIGVQADGSALYTVQALWTYAREQLDITTVLCDNASYAILAGELQRVGAAQDGARAGRLLDLGDPAVDWVSVATGLGVPATRATTAEELAEQLAKALAEPGPHLIDAVLAPRPG